MGFDLEKSGGGKNRGSDQNFSIWVRVPCGNRNASRGIEPRQPTGSKTFNGKKSVKLRR